MTTTEPREGHNMADHALATLPFLTMLGFAGLVTNIFLSFEEPQTSMLVGSGLLLVVAPLGMALHLASTSQLSLEEKRRWVSGLLSPRGPNLFSAYFNLAHRRKMTHTLSRAASEIEPGSEA